MWKIANRFGTTINQLKTANNLTNDNLKVGQILIIPNNSTGTGTNYTVKNGDSLWKIANQFGITISELKNANGLTGDNLSVGQILTIPNEKPIMSENTYTVKTGDSLWSIARKYNTTVDTLKTLNNITSDTLSVGQTLKVPSGESGTNRTYTVRDGDSLWKIANQYGTTVSKIRELNGLSTNDLRIGQVLRIP